MLCDLFVIVGWSWTKYMSSRDHRGRAWHPETEQIYAMENGGVPELPHHPCESAASTSNGHNVLV